jgi:hypothetical protein
MPTYKYEIIRHDVLVLCCTHTTLSKLGPTVIYIWDDEPHMQYALLHSLHTGIFVTYLYPESTVTYRLGLHTDYIQIISKKSLGHLR